MSTMSETYCSKCGNDYDYDEHDYIEYGIMFLTCDCDDDDGL